MKFKLEVFVSRRPHMRDPNLEFMLHRGKTVLENLFDDERTDGGTTKIQMWYPERWCNIVEERSILRRLERLYLRLEHVQIITQSVYIIQCTPAENVFIFNEPSEVMTQESDSGRLWFPNHQVPNFNKLQVF